MLMVCHEEIITITWEVGRIILRIKFNLVDRVAKFLYISRQTIVIVYYLLFLYPKHTESDCSCPNTG